VCGIVEPLRQEGRAQASLSRRRLEYRSVRRCRGQENADHVAEQRTKVIETTTCTTKLDRERGETQREGN